VLAVTAVLEAEAAKALLALLEQYVTDHHGKVPQDVRLEIHPSAMHALSRHWPIGYQDLLDPDQRSPVIGMMPVKIDIDLPERGWRLVRVVEDVINGGVIPDG
jgi:hypothetical protein